MPPITLSQSQTAPPPAAATRTPEPQQEQSPFITASSQSSTVPAGTILTGSDGVQIVTNQDAVIPQATPNPLAFGQVTVAAQASQSGSRGNISAYDINETCCSSGILAKNTDVFRGGADARDYQFVTKTDINSAATPLKAALAQSVNGALQGQLKNNKSLVTPSCATAITSDHQPGDEATTVKITVSETCAAAAVGKDALNAKVTDLLDHQAAIKLGSGYGILGNPQVTVTSATVSKQVTLSFTSVSTWVYALSSAEQNHIKKIIAGKTKENALHLLLSLPGIESASINSSGFGRRYQATQRHRAHSLSTTHRRIRNLSPESTKVVEFSLGDV